MKKLLSILNHIESNCLKYNIINEHHQLRIEIYKNDQYINCLTVCEYSLHLGVNINCGFVKVELEALMDYISRID